MGESIMWLVIAAVLLVIEAVTVGLTTIWFAGGAVIAALAAYLGANLILELVLFLGVSVILLVFTRPLAVRYMNRGIQKTNVDSLIGKKAVVIQEIDNLGQTGQVRINDIEWMARTLEDDVRIPANAIVTILEVRGVKLIVKEKKEV
ncbi:MAG: NfeD family protein [Eubacteriales bacterium]|nr:NfeD family protein [Eubacteriales bacterium]